MPSPPVHERAELSTSDGVTLEAEWALPASDQATTRVVILCHPHPLYGGNMHAGVVDGLFRSLPAHGMACLRFNFRGVDVSGGRHDEGRGERLDVVAALDAAVARFPEAAITLGGWSFGADVSLAVDDDRHAGWLSVAPPLAIVPPEEMAAPADPRPKALIVPAHDQYNPPSSAAARTATWANTSMEVIESADHFLAGHQATVDRLALDALG